MDKKDNIFNPVNQFELSSVLAGIAFLTRLTLPITALTVFRDPNYSKNVISIDNRFVYILLYMWDGPTTKTDLYYCDKCKSTFHTLSAFEEIFPFYYVIYG